MPSYCWLRSRERAQGVSNALRRCPAARYRASIGDDGGMALRLKLKMCNDRLREAR